jgi:serine protease Do
MPTAPASPRRIRPLAALLAPTAALAIAVVLALPVQSQQPTLQPVDFVANKINIRHGATIGRSKCSITDNSELKWAAGRIIENSREFRDIFLDAANAMGIPTTSRSNSVFSSLESTRQQPGYLVASAIARMDIRGCVWDFDRNDKITVAVDWEVFSLLEDRVVYQEQVEGIFVPRKAVSDGLGFLIANAYRDAAVKLMESPGFRQAIARAPGADAQMIAPVAGERWLLPAVPTFQAPVQQNIDYITSAAVTIETGTGHGSGFFLTPDGWIMTNAHVTRGHRVVKVVLADGRFVYGQTVRVHDTRDVALIKADGAGYPALPLRLQPLRLTEEVYAVGTPIDKKLRASVTRGIISQFRTNERHLVDIQADVTVHGGSSGGPLIDGFGNVVGITYSGAGGARSAAGKNIGAGINFFIPIQDALEKLNLQLAAQ